MYSDIIAATSPHMVAVPWGDADSTGMLSMLSMCLCMLMSVMLSTPHNTSLAAAYINLYALITCTQHYRAQFLF